MNLRTLTGLAPKASGLPGCPTLGIGGPPENRTPISGLQDQRSTVELAAHSYGSAAGDDGLEPMMGIEPAMGSLLASSSR